MKPYIVSLETDVVVMAEDARAAEMWARKNWYKLSDDLGPDNFDMRASKMLAYPGGWDKNCLPYGSTDDKTLGDILAHDEDYQKKLRELKGLQST